MHRGRGSGNRGRGFPARGRGGYQTSRGKESYRYERDDHGHGRSRRYDPRPRSRSRSRSRSPRRRRSRTRSRSRERYRDSYYKERRSLTPPRKDRGLTDSEGLRITIQPRKDDYHYDDRAKHYYEERNRHYHEDRERRRRSRSLENYSSSKKRDPRRSSSSSSRSSSSRSKSRSRYSPSRGRSKDRDWSRSSRGASPEESLRITVGNDRYLQKASAVERLGPPVRKEDAKLGQYTPGKDTISRNDSYKPAPQERPEQAGLPTSQIGVYPTRNSAEKHIFPRETSIPFPGRTNEDDLYSCSRLDHGNDFFSSSSSIPINDTRTKDNPLPLLPGLAQTLDIDDEDKFLYGDDDEDKTPEFELGQTKLSHGTGDVTKLPSGLIDTTEHSRSHINEYGDQDYRMRSDPHQQLANRREDSFGRDSVHETSLERDLYRHSPSRNEPFSSRDLAYSAIADLVKGKVMRQSNGGGQHSSTREIYSADDFDNHGLQTRRGDPGRSVDENYGATDRYSDTRDGRERKPQTEHFEEKKNVDPTLENILKSIGFNFQLSKLMQEKAQKEREKQLKKQELEYTVRKGASFMDGGLKDVDLKSVFDDKDTFEKDVRRREAEEALSRYTDEAKRGIKRGVIGTAETYEQMAKKYREEQAKAYEDEHQRRSQEMKAYEDEHLRKRSQEVKVREDEHLRRSQLEKAYEDEHLRRSQQKVHPLDYLTESYTRESRDDSAMMSQIKDYKHQSARAEHTVSQSNTVDYEDSGRHYREKLFEDDDDHRGRNEGRKYKYGDARESQIYETDSRYEKQNRRNNSEERYYKEQSLGSPRSSEAIGRDKMDDRKKRRPPQIYSSQPGDGRRHSRSPRDKSCSKERFSEPITQRQGPAPSRDLAENDLRNVLIASDKASKRTVLPPKSDRERSKQTQSPRQEEVIQRRMIPVLSTKEREQLEREKEQRKKRLDILENELDKLRKQQGEMMRKKQRQKDGHKDPLLVENSKLQDEITKQITVLRKAVENQNQNTCTQTEESKVPVTAVKFKMEKLPKMVKGQTILGESSSESEEEKKDRDKAQGGKKTPSKSAKPVTPPRQDKVKSKKQGNSTSPSKNEEKKHDKTEKADVKPKPKFHVNYEFFDPGNHWCRKCNVVSSNVYEVFQHLQKKQHISKMDNYDRPWMPESLKNPKPKARKGQSVAVPIQGVEFMMSTQAFFCRLCKVFSGDASCAEHHLKSEEHYKAYQIYINENPFYEQRLNLDKAAGISTATHHSEDEKKHDAGDEKQRKDSSDDHDVSAAERVKQQKRAIERELREKEEEDQRKKMKLEDEMKRSAEAEKEKQNKEGRSYEKVRLEFPATGKIGKMTWAKQQQRLQEKIKQRQEEAKEREASQQKNKLQFSFGRTPPSFQAQAGPKGPVIDATGPKGPRIDATTFMKKLKEEKQKNQSQDHIDSRSNLDQFLTIGENSLPVVTEDIPLPDDNTAKSVTKNETVPVTQKSQLEQEREEDFRLLGIDPGSTSVMDIKNRPPVMASRKPTNISSSLGSSGAATSASSLYSVFNAAKVSTLTNKSVTNTKSSGSETTTTAATRKIEEQESSPNASGPPPAVGDNCQTDDMDLESEGSISMGDFEVLDEVA